MLFRSEGMEENMRIVSLTKETTKDILEDLLKRSPNNYGNYEAAVAEILNKVRLEGDRALFDYTGFISPTPTRTR